jgi:cytosine/adenosine deaminase-related metal-dependent hydrolase
VDAGLIIAVGTHEAMVAARPHARVRRWPGLLMPGLRHPQAVALLEGAYHPDPREAGELGTEPITGEALAALAMDDARWGASARRGLQRLLGHGVTAVAGPFARPAVRTAVARSGLRVREPRAPHERESLALDPFALFPLNALIDGEVTVGGPADFAVFDVPVDEVPARALRLGGGRSCVATVLGGRLVYRRR